MVDSFAHGPPPVPDICDSNRDAIEKQEVLEYHPDSDTYRSSFDSETESVTMAVTSTVAVVSETQPMELPSLCSVCDPDALETVVQPPVPGPSNIDIHVTFTFADHPVTVHSYGIITVRPPETDEDEPVNEKKQE